MNEDQERIQEEINNLNETLEALGDNVVVLQGQINDINERQNPTTQQEMWDEWDLEELTDNMQVARETMQALNVQIEQRQGMLANVGVNNAVPAVDDDNAGPAVDDDNAGPAIDGEANAPTIADVMNAQQNAQQPARNNPQIGGHRN